MTLTYIPIASTTLSTAQTVVTFSSIPATYTDLVVRLSARRSASGRTDLDIWFNSDTTNYSRTHLQGNGATATSGTGSGSKLRVVNVVTGATDTADSFNSVELYIPNYLSSTSKPISADGAHETNSTTAFRVVAAGLWYLSPAEAITSISFQGAAGDFASGSTFHLYGII